jgi:putative transcriptional regulator
MNSEIEYFKIETNHKKPERGCILIAEPFLNDIYFKRSIIFLTEHNDEGSVGFVLNKPVTMQLNEIISDFPKFECDLSIGGPVGTNTVHFIHTLGNLIPNSVKVAENIYWGGDFDVLKQLISENVISNSQVRFFLGYSGWTKGQLDEELEQNSWLVSEIDAQMVMHHSMNSVWQDTLTQLGSKYRMWINSPENPSLN